MVSLNGAAGTTQVTTGSPYTLTDISNTALWSTFNTTCNVSDSDIATECSALGGSCIGITTDFLTTFPTGLDHYYYNTQTSFCHRSIAVSADLSTINADANSLFSTTSDVTLEWNAFSVIGAGSITGYNVYRRPALNVTDLKDFDYEWPINKVTLSASATSFTDSIASSWQPPVSGTVYYYEVRPLINGVETATKDTFSKIRIISPPPNMAFAHQWIINENVCKLLGYTTYSASTIDPYNSYRCPFKGWGDSVSAGTYYYDIGKDYLVPRYEFGCPYSGAPACTWTSDGSCIGASAPGTNAAAALGNVYYNRASGVCSVYTAANTWTDLNNATPSDAYDYLITGNKYISALLPPISNLDAAHASYMCTQKMTSTHTRSSSTSKFMVKGLRDDPAYILPTRKEQIALSQWHPDTSDATATTLEEGLSLNSSSKCNSSSASGLTSGYVDADFPASINIYSLPGTATSGIRSMATGTQYTGQCVSRFGIQDLIGNVAEWSGNLYAWSGTSTAGTGSIRDYGLDTFISTDSSTYIPSILTSAYGANEYLLNVGDSFTLGVAIGPVIDTDNDGKSDSHFSAQVATIADEGYNIGYMSIPYGLPVNSAWYTSTLAGLGASQIADQTEFDYMKASIAEIGASNGITSAKLRADSITLDTNSAGAAGTYQPVSAGGSYLNGTGAGVWNFFIAPTSTTIEATSGKADIGYRCVLPIAPDTTNGYLE